MKVIKSTSFLLIVLGLFLSQYNKAFAVTLKSLVEGIAGGLASSVIRVIFGLAIVYFLWGVLQYTLYPDDENKKEKGKSVMLWGIIGLTVMFSVYGLIRVLINTLLL